MKLTLVVFAALVAIACATLCTNNDPATCAFPCPSGSVDACEHSVCTCSKVCSQSTDCPACPAQSDPAGHNHHDEAHCLDGACLCMRPLQDINPCTMPTECPACSTHTDSSGQVHQERAVCFDGYCRCTGTHHGPPGGF